VSVLDFKEIPQANLATGDQDRFELFARDFLVYKGFEVLENPSRGSDGGKDMIVRERRTGLAGSTEIKWLVSCKHFAHRGKSVGVDDENNIVERVLQHKCDGFLGVYSTICSAGLSDRLVELQSQFETYRYDCASIEGSLLATPEGIQLANRYFPESMRKAGPVPAKVFGDEPHLECEECGRDLLTTTQQDAIYVVWRDTKFEDGEIVRDDVVDVYFSCKRQCDRILKVKMREKHSPRRLIDSWDDIPDMFVPTVYLAKVMAFLNSLQSKTVYSEEAFDKIKRLLICTFPRVCRHPNASDEANLERLKRIPSYLGGMGYNL